MRDLRRNQRTIWYSLYKGKEPLLDMNGDETGDYVLGYEKPRKLEISLSASKGSARADIFGANIEYSRTIQTTDVKMPINEYSLVWYENEPVIRADGSVDTSSADYEVSAIADGLDVLVIALKRLVRNA